MTTFERWTLQISTGLVAGTGLVYAWMLYGLEPVDEFAVANHPLQGTVQHLHVLVAPLLVFALGLIFREHIWRGVTSGSRQRRSSGLVMLTTLFPMIASGYLLQTAGSEAGRKLWVAVHLITSGLWLLGYLAHWLAKLRATMSRHS